MSKKMKKALLILLIGYLIFVAITYAFYRHIRYNSTDAAAREYIFQSEDIRNQIGEISSIGRNIAEDSVKTDTRKELPYSVYPINSNHCYIIYVIFENNNGEWNITGYSIAKRTENG